MTTLPTLGDQTGPQPKPPSAEPGFAFNYLGMSASDATPGWGPIPASTFRTYRKISAVPTVAEVMSIVKGPVVHNDWKVKHKPGYGDQAAFIDGVFAPLKDDFVFEALHALEFGCWKMEQVYDVVDGKVVVSRIKSLTVDDSVTRIMGYKKSGDFAGFEQGEGKDKVVLGPEYCLLFTYDGEPGNLHGRSRHENIKDAYGWWEQTNQKLAQYCNRIIGPVPIIYYPDGTSKDENGADRPNHYLAQRLGLTLAKGGYVLVPNLFASQAEVDINRAADLAGKSQWMIETLKTDGNDYLNSLINALMYYDRLLFRGWLRPERVGLEAQRSGSRADAQTHSDASVLDCETIAGALARCINKQLVDRLLKLNFGADAVGKVWFQPDPIVDNTIVVLQHVLDGIVQSKDLAPTVLNQISVPRLLAEMSVPQLAEGEKPSPIIQPPSQTNANE